ncbi:hypothetical protein Pelo_19466 [Pelomyxa schiedti]|nr:hypothetical protein Pelo_19466 [Pelomyxa schiedti]
MACKISCSALCMFHSTHKMPLQCLHFCNFALPMCYKCEEIEGIAAEETLQQYSNYKMPCCPYLLLLSQPCQLGLAPCLVSLFHSRFPQTEDNLNDEAEQNHQGKAFDLTLC